MILPDFMVPEGLVGVFTVFKVMAVFEPLLACIVAVVKRFKKEGMVTDWSDMVTELGNALLDS